MVNPFDEELLIKKSSLCRIFYFCGIFVLWTVNLLKNVFVDFSRERQKQFSAFLCFSAAIQVIFKMISLAANFKKVLELKKQILKEAENISEEDFTVEKKYRKITRVVLPLLSFNYFFAVSLLFIYPMFSTEKFSVPFHVQLPGTK